MIVDNIENGRLYAGVSKRVAKALEVLKDTDFSNKTDGRYDIDGDNIYYLVQRYTTKPIEQGRLEAHKKYIDVQFMAGGGELMGLAPIDNLETEEPYNEENDIAFYKAPEQITKINLETGMFCILFPQDAHMPGRQSNGPSNVLKVVVKAKVNG